MRDFIRDLTKIKINNETLPPTILSQVQTFLRDPPADAPCKNLKTELFRLTSVSDRQRYHALGDSWPSERLRRMSFPVGNMTIDDKFFRGIFLERLTTSVQTILGSGSEDLDTTKLADMADRMIEVERLSSTVIAQFTPDIRHIDGSRNEVADALSRPSIAHLQLSSGIDLAVVTAEQRRVGSPCDEDVFGLKLQELPLTTGNDTILCDEYNPPHCPSMPPSLRRKIFPYLHNLSHPGDQATDKLVSDRFVCSKMYKDRKLWTRAYLGCQRSKVQRHNKAPIGIFPTPDSRFSHVHLDIVGPLPLSNGYTRIQTTAHHLAANGMVGRFHRQFKTSLRAVDDPEDWTDHLHLALLGIRSKLKPDLDCSTVELAFGATVRLPGEMISPNPSGTVEDPTKLLDRFQQFMRTLPSASPWSTASPSYLEKDLATCSHVYLRFA
ncbi:hypothetical protein SprV_0301189700 [Sparganum proliferum]